MFHLHSRVHPHPVPTEHTATTVFGHQPKYTADELKEYRQIFNMFDTDGSGAIGSEELRHAMLENGLSAAEEEIDALIQEPPFFSVDADGNGEIDFDEFCACMKKTQSKSRRITLEDLTKQCFEVFDVDKDGVITEAEFKYVAKNVGDFTDELADFVWHELDVTGSGCFNTDQFMAIVEDYMSGDVGGTNTQRSN